MRALWIEQAAAPLSFRRCRLRGSHWPAAIAVVVAAFGTAAASLIVLTPMKDAAASLIAAGRPLSAGALLAAVGPLAWILAALGLASAALPVAMQWRSGAVAALLRETSGAQAAVVLLALLGWSGHAYWFPGLLLGGDAGTHVTRFFQVRTGLLAGGLPQWDNYDYLGSSLLGFTGPLTYVVGGALDVLVRAPTVTAKMLLFALHVAAGWLFYGLLRGFGIGRGSALVAALGFAGSFALLHLFLYRGVFPQAFTLAFLVLLFLAAERLMQSAAGPPSAWSWLLTALASGGLVLTHQPHALFAAAYLGLFGLTSLLLGRWAWRRLAWLLAAGLMGGAIGAVAVAPVLVEADWVMIEPSHAMFGLRLPAPDRLLHLLLWRNTQTTWGADYWAYLGLPFVLLAGLGLVCGLAGQGEVGQGEVGQGAAGQRRLAVAALPPLALTFFMHNPVVRDVMFMMLFLGIYAALGLSWLAARHGRWLLPAAALVLLDVGSTSVQPVARSDKQFIRDAGDDVAQALPPARVMQVNFERDGTMAADIGPDGTILAFAAPVQRIAGHHNMAATLVHNYAETTVKLAERDLRGGALSPAARQLLAQFNVARIVCAQPFAMGCPASFAGAVPQGRLGRTISIAEASPALFSTALTQFDPAGFDKPMLWVASFDPANPMWPEADGVEDALRRFLRAAGIDASGRLAAAIPVRHLPLQSAPPAGHAAPQFAVLDYRVSLQTVRLEVNASQPGFVQLAHPWYPATRVLRNGQPVQAMQGSLGLMVLPVAAGTTVIELSPSVTPVRAASGWLSAAALLASVLAAGAAASRRRTSP